MFYFVNIDFLKIKVCSGFLFVHLFGILYGYYLVL